MDYIFFCFFHVVSKMQKVFTDVSQLNISVVKHAGKVWLHWAASSCYRVSVHALQNVPGLNLKKCMDPNGLPLSIII